MVRKAVNKYDPLNLMNAGAPQDEYDSIVSRAISIFVNNKEISTEDKVTLLTQALVKQYGDEANKGSVEIGNLQQNIEAAVQGFVPDKTLN